MKRHIIYNKINGNIDSVITWGDNRDFPENYPLGPNQEVKTITDDSIQVDGISCCYDTALDSFGEKLSVTCDTIQINHIDGVANIGVAYPSPIDEVCILTVDGQTLEIDVVDGVVDIPFTSQVLGWHNISISSSSHFGKDSVNVEVI